MTQLDSTKPKKLNEASIPGVNLVGYFKDTRGLSEAARFFATCLQTQQIPFSLISVDDLMHNDRDSKDTIEHQHIYPITVICCDPMTIDHIVKTNKFKFWNTTYNIGILFWESNKLSRKVRTACNYLDEIWVTSRYVQEHLSAAVSCPVHRIANPVSPINPMECIDAKKAFHLENKFTFLFCFDFRSSMARKNPLAVIQAFQRAFPSDPQVQLIVKSQFGQQCPSELEEIVAFTRQDSRVISMDQSLSSQDRHDLMNACDCYVSLHRSEGLGLTMAEAMLLEKPVIATGYSGNLDFMNEENSFLCSYVLKPIGKGHPFYPADGMWADPDIEQAAFWMKSVVNDPIEAHKKAQKGKEFILKYHSHDTVGHEIANRLRKIPSHKVPKFPTFFTRIWETHLKPPLKRILLIDSYR